MTKFRGKRIDNGEWVYGYYVCDMDKHFILCKEKYSDYRISWNEVDPKTVGQWTGLTDKNKVDVYAGDYNQDYDVVRWCDIRNGWAMAIYDIPTKDFMECHCYNCSGNFEIDEDIQNFEIIGNIYETKGE